MNKLIHFIKYHNSIPIALSLIAVVFGGVFAASPEVQEIFVSSEQVVRSIDNSYIISADLTAFSPELQIKDITEDPENYYVAYSYRTIGIIDYSWQNSQREKILTVSKKALGENKDLGLYVAEELGENMDYEYKYLKEVKQLEQAKGLSQKVVATEYSGLIGKFLSPEEKTFSGYEPVIPKTEQVIGGSLQVTGDSEPIELLVSGVQTIVQQVETVLAPETIIDSFPASLVASDQQASFAFHSSKPESFFQCKIDLVDWENCSSSKTYSGLSLGGHTFQVFATDSGGNYDRTPASFSWIVTPAEAEIVEIAPIPISEPITESVPEPSPDSATTTE